MIKVALLCTNDTAELRPTMSSVVSMLEGKTAVPEVEIFYESMTLIPELVSDQNDGARVDILEEPKEKTTLLKGRKFKKSLKKITGKAKIFRKMWRGKVTPEVQLCSAHPSEVMDVLLDLRQCNITTNRGK